MEDSFANIIEDVFRDDSITSSKCIGYLSRVKALYGDEPEGDARKIEPPLDFYGNPLSAGDRVRKVACRLPYGWKPESKEYTIQSCELWEDGWTVNVYDMYGEMGLAMQPGDVCLWSAPTLRDVMASFASDYANDIREGGDGEKVIDEYETILCLKESEEGKDD